MCNGKKDSTKLGRRIPYAPNLTPSDCFSQAAKPPPIGPQVATSKLLRTVCTSWAPSGCFSQAVKPLPISWFHASCVPMTNPTSHKQVATSKLLRTGCTYYSPTAHWRTNFFDAEITRDSQFFAAVMAGTTSLMFVKLSSRSGISRASAHSLRRCCKRS